MNATVAYFIIAALSIVSGTVAATLDAAAFHPYVGRITPGLAIAAAAAIGILCLRVLQTHGMAGTRPWTDRPWPFPAFMAAASILALLTIAMDVLLRFPQDINVAWPQALLFYPAIGFIAEVIFHLVPLALLALVISRVPGLSGTRMALGLCIALTALVEPVFQVAASLTVGAPSALDLYVLVALFIFGVLQLIALRRFGFAAMYVLRLVYYSWWHLAWGPLRLEWLF